LTPEGVWVNLYGQSTANLKLSGKSITLIQQTKYAWDGEIEITVQPDEEMFFSLFLRIPGWSRNVKIEVNGEPFEGDVKPGTYVEISRLWKPGDRVQLSLPIHIKRVISHPFVMENADRVALMRGPLVYCVEQADNPGFDVWKLLLPWDSNLEDEWKSDLLNGIVIIRGKGLVDETEGFEEQLYLYADEVASKMRLARFVAIPYFAWANREAGPMTVWLRSWRGVTKNSIPKKRLPRTL
jgi:DUF1680 family protein